MTVRYEDRIRHFLFRWRASVWRLVWPDLLVFCVLYAAISCLYRFGLTTSQRRTFEAVVVHFQDVSKYSLTILSLLLGFYVNKMVSRWWSQFELIPWPEELLGFVTFVIPDNSEKSRCIRRSVARYFCLTTALAGRHFSPPLLQRYPTENDLVKAGLMTPSEVELYKKTAPDVRWLLPMQWVQKIMVRATDDREIPAPLTQRIQTEINDCVIRFRKLFCYDWINIPMVYTQVVAVGTYFYYATCLIGHQFISPDRFNQTSIEGTRIPAGMETVDYYVPVATILQLIFYLGWFRVGQNLMKPFGFDDEDFELSNLLDRHIQVAFAVADHPEQKCPEPNSLVPEMIGIPNGNDIVHDSRPLHPPLCSIREVKRRIKHGEEHTKLLREA